MLTLCPISIQMKQSPKNLINPTERQIVEAVAGFPKTDLVKGLAGGKHSLVLMKVMAFDSKDYVYDEPMTSLL